MADGERTISAVVPVYNGATTLGDTLESIRRQTVPPHEVVVVDDGSRDGSADLAAQHAVRPRVVRLEGNHGVAYARNVGLREAGGDLVAFVDQDDLWLPGRVERVGRALRDHRDWRVVVTDEMVFAAEEDRAALEAMNHPFASWVEHWRPRAQILSLLDELERSAEAVPGHELLPVRRVLSGSVTVTTSYVLDRELAMGCGGFAAWLRSADDWILLQTLSRYTEIHRLHDKSVLYRVHPSNTSTTTDWPMPLMVAAAAVRLGGLVVPRGADRDPDVVGGLESSPFLQHVLTARARTPGWRARCDALAAWQLLSTDGTDRRRSGRSLARSLVAGAAPGWARSAAQRLRGGSHS